MEECEVNIYSKNPEKTRKGGCPPLLYHHPLNSKIEVTHFGKTFSGFLKFFMALIRKFFDSILVLICL